MSNMSTQFSDPGGGGDFIDFKAINGSLLLFDVKGFEEGVTTTFGVKPAVRADVAVLDGQFKSERYVDALVFPMKLVGQLKTKLGQHVLGRLERGNAKPGQEAPWQLATATDDDRATAGRYLTYLEAQTAQFEEPF